MIRSTALLATVLLAGAVWAQEGQKAKKQPDTPAANSQSTKSSTAPAELTTQTYKGTLMDASCAGSGGRKTTSQDTAKQSSAADRAAGDQSQNCALSGSTKEFALRTKDGKVLRFDQVGNQRAGDAIKNKKKWSEAASGGKSVQAKVSGHLEGDELTVLSVD